MQGRLVAIRAWQKQKPFALDTKYEALDTMQRVQLAGPGKRGDRAAVCKISVTLFEDEDEV